MRIGIDGHVLGKNIGAVERYVEKVVELVPALRPQHQFVIFVPRQSHARLAAKPRPNVQYVRLPVSDPIAQRSVVLPWSIRQHDLDVLHVQRIAPWACGRCRILLTVHDLIPLKYASAYPGFRNQLVRLLTPSSIARADLIVCPTKTVCQDIDRLYPGASAPRRAFYNGVDRATFSCPDTRADRGTLRRHDIDGRFLFSPGAIEERKNLEVIVQALAKLDEDQRPLLVLSGSIRDARCFARVQKRAAELGVARQIRHIGFVSNEDLVDLYGQATACVAASIDEGFNLLPLEAMACGAPVLCSDIRVHRELFQGAVSFFPADNADLLADGIRHILETGGDGVNPDDVEACISRFSWEAMAQRMATFFDELD